MNGFHFVTMRHMDGQTVQFAFPAQILNGNQATDLARFLCPGWIDTGRTWRASFDQHCQPANSSPTYQSGMHNEPHVKPKDELESMV